MKYLKRFNESISEEYFSLTHENLMKKVESDIDNYKNLLMEHLDYIPSDKFHVGKITHRIGSQVSFSKESVRFECKIKIDL